jgi:hypothetical protein
VFPVFQQWLFYLHIVISFVVIIIIVIIVITILIQEFSASLLSFRTLQFPTHPTAVLPVITV